MRYLILGGTGTLGRALTRKLLENPENRVTCLSRDELKQKQMASEFKNDRLSFVLGDIRDLESLLPAMRNVDVCFHVAALKHIDTLEMNPEESVKTNILGTINVANAAEAASVPEVVFSSTDKAVEPINAYGMSKGISERILLNRNRTQARTHYSIFRWGNVCGSRGSAIQGFAQSLRDDRKAYITDKEMTRFWIRIEDAVDFMLANYRMAMRIQIPSIKAAPVTQVIRVLAKLLDVGVYSLEHVGMRPGEKLHESLEVGISSDKAPALTDDELEAMLKPILLLEFL